MALPVSDWKNAPSSGVTTPPRRASRVSGVGRCAGSFTGLAHRLKGRESRCASGTIGERPSRWRASTGLWPVPVAGYVGRAITRCVWRWRPPCARRVMQIIRLAGEVCCSSLAASAELGGTALFLAIGDLREIKKSARVGSRSLKFFNVSQVRGCEGITITMP